MMLPSVLPKRFMIQQRMEILMNLLVHIVINYPNLLISCTSEHVVFHCSTSVIVVTDNLILIGVQLHGPHSYGGKHSNVKFQ